MNYIKEKKELLIDNAFILIGCFISSLGVNLFLSNAKLLSGGATGIALIFQYLMGVNSGIVVLLINIPLFILSYFKLSKQFTFNSAIGMLALSLSLMITAPVSHLITLDDKLLYCVFGGAICGFGYGLVFSKGGSTGGTDIVTMVIRKKYSNFNIGSLSFILNMCIVGIGAIFFGLETALYTLISIFVQTVLVDKVIKGIHSKQLLLIITDKEQQVINYIIEDLHRGVTSLLAEGEYTHDRKKMLYCLVTTRQMIELKNTIHYIDPNAFITIMDVSEVKGKGFKNI
ncbi:YitT family protein [Clostridium perfringens]|uniref:Putative membrane protein n=1 Tax=Clostridium perfringens (strain SM101 / Type A) TaxID=289380 RepID=Q0SQI2_CLOPS|nr:YitT family protein [Clostridium perfringens]ABG85759.1 putative membrane protein [Clostridium perfringens SM101]EJT5916448.1 YitT family protein [Clostridium perfringens]EJT5924229.1 YitT family protein [Clostridium perfringens]EJT5939059.1 YitT family protein [Clostridium perfringens]EJT6135176.1 YitT family protein [Clostridium perfringens]